MTIHFSTQTGIVQHMAGLVGRITVEQVEQHVVAYAKIITDKENGITLQGVCLRRDRQASRMFSRSACRREPNRSQFELCWICPLSYPINSQPFWIRQSTAIHNITSSTNFIKLS